MRKDTDGARPCILGIDPGFGRLGFGIIEKRGRDWRPITYACVETDPNDTLANRLRHIHVELCSVLDSYTISHAAVEELFFHKNVTTALAVAQARGVVLLTLASYSLPILEFTPLQIKQAVAGFGRADKKAIFKMVELTLGVRLFGRIHDDAVDALAVALTAIPYIK